MRKFKLIKEFPLSPAKGTIATFKTMQEEIEGIYDMGAIPNLILTDCTQFPEFWEEVKEQEFEILEFTAQVTGLKHVLREDGKYNPNGLSKETLLEHSVLPLQITKIKQLFDNEDFSIGDDVLFYGTSTKIKEIYYNEYNQLSFKVEGNVAPLTGCFMKNHPHFKKAPKPLFVTEDNVEIFEGDEYFSVRLDTLEILKPNENWASSLKLIKYFSTKEAAEKYIDENKPIYSKKQIKEALDTTVSPLQWYDATILRQKLKL